MSYFVSPENRSFPFPSRVCKQLRDQCYALPPSIELVVSRLFTRLVCKPTLGSVVEVNYTRGEDGDDRKSLTAVIKPDSVRRDESYAHHMRLCIATNV